MKNKFTDVDFEEIEPKIYYTIPQIAKIIDEDEKRTRYWGNEFGTELLVEIVSGRRKFSQDSLERFKLIKKLIDECNFSKVQIQRYFKDLESKRGDKYSDYENATELINPKDPLGMEVLATQLTLKMEKQIEDKLNSFINDFIDYQETLTDKITDKITGTLIQKIEHNNEKVTVILDEINKKIETGEETNFNSIKADVNLVKSEINNLSTDILKELKEQNISQQKLIEDLSSQLDKRDNEICSKLKQTLETRKENKKSLFNFFKR